MAKGFVTFCTLSRMLEFRHRPDQNSAAVTWKWTGDKSMCRQVWSPPRTFAVRSERNHMTDDSMSWVMLPHACHGSCCHMTTCGTMPCHTHRRGRLVQSFWRRVHLCFCFFKEGDTEGNRGPDLCVLLTPKLTHPPPIVRARCALLVGPFLHSVLVYFKILFQVQAKAESS